MCIMLWQCYFILKVLLKISCIFPKNFLNLFEKNEIDGYVENLGLYVDDNHNQIVFTPIWQVVFCKLDKTGKYDAGINRSLSQKIRGFVRNY